MLLRVGGNFKNLYKQSTDIIVEKNFNRMEF